MNDLFKAIELLKDPRVSKRKKKKLLKRIKKLAGVQSCTM